LYAGKWADLREAALRIWKKGCKGKKRPEGWSELLKMFANNLPTSKTQEGPRVLKVGFFFCYFNLKGQTTTSRHPFLCLSWNFLLQ
jgi:hypothetical protein